MPMLQTRTAVLASRINSANSCMLLRGRPACCSSVGQSKLSASVLSSVRPAVCCSMKSRSCQPLSKMIFTTPYRIAVRIYEHDFRAELFGLMEVFGGDRLIVRRIGAEEHDQAGAPPIFVAAGRGGDADGVLHGAGRRGVAKPRRVVDIVRP